MIKKVMFIAVTGILLIVSCGENADNTENQKNKTSEIEKSIPEIKLPEFDSLASEFTGKEVKISGIVDHVCKHGGKKILLVDGDYSLHVFSDERFDEALSGSKVIVTGIVGEKRTDSVSLAEMLKHDEGSLGGGTDADKEKLEQIREYVKMMQDSLKKAGVPYFSEFYLKLISFEEEK
ncbi:MAG: hypothetical protein GXO50_01950 [Chlorobi bacterium]|nr:hypothetical protein [Chlorobiota bacterium]